MVDLAKGYIMKLLSTIKIWKFWLFIVNLTILANLLEKIAIFSISKN
jgi:hypothetical protein